MQARVLCTALELCMQRITKRADVAVLYQASLTVSVTVYAACRLQCTMAPGWSGAAGRMCRWTPRLQTPLPKCMYKALCWLFI